MTTNAVRGSLRAIGRGAVETSLFLPALVTAAATVMPDHSEMLWLASFPLLYFAAYLIGSSLLFRQRYRMLAAAALLGVVHGYLFAGAGTSKLAVAAGAIAAFIVGVRGIGSAYLQWRVQFPLMQRMTVLIVYFVAYIILFNLSLFDAYIPLLTWTGLAAFVYVLLDANRQTLKDQSFEASDRVDPAIVALNRSLMACILLLALVIALFNYIRDAMLWLRDRIAALLSGLQGDAKPIEQPPADQPPPMDLPGDPAGEPAAWLVLLEKLMYALFYVIIAALAAWLLYTLVRRLPVLLRRLYGWMVKVTGRERSQAGYEDRIESLVDKAALNKRLSGFVKGLLQRKRGPKWSQLQNNRERIRFMYASLLRRSAARGYGVKSHLTPQETARDLDDWSRGRGSKETLNGADMVAAAYDAARYGSEPIDDEEVRRLKSLLDDKT